MRNLRLISTLPPSQAVSTLGPFQTISNIHSIAGVQIGAKVLTDVTSTQEHDLLVTCRKAMQSSQTIGICPAEVKIRAVFFDMDATVIVEESIVELARVAGKAAEVAEITDRAMAGKLDFRDALIGRVAFLKGLPAGVLRDVADKLTLNDGIKEFAEFCRTIGVPIFLISGGFQALAEIISAEVGFAGVLANSLEIVDGKLSGKVSGAIIDAQAKKDFLLNTCLKLGITPSEAAAVGDGANDIPMLQTAGVAIGYKPKDILIPHIQAANYMGDHRLLQPLLFGQFA